MTDSLRLSVEAKRAKIEALREKLGPPVNKRELTEISALPMWVKNTLAAVHINGLTYAEALIAVGRRNKEGKPKGASSLADYKMSPAGKAWIAALKQALAEKSPEDVVRDVLKASLLNVTFDKLGALELAKAHGDYVVVDKIASDILDRGGVTKQSPQHGQSVVPQIIINLPAGLTAAPATVESDFKVIDAPADIQDD